MLHLDPNREPVTPVDAATLLVLREGAGEIMAHCIYVGTDRGMYLDRLFDLLAHASHRMTDNR